MLKVNKKNEPDFFLEFKKKRKVSNWKDVPPELKNSIREFMKNESEGKCPYCEIDIKNDFSEIEHIRPKDKFPHLLLQYDNLICTCREANRCGNKKGNSWNEKFINPVTENPDDFFEYDIKTGEIIPKENEISENVEKAEYTIDILNLNQLELMQVRKKLIIQMYSMREYLEIFSDFPSLVKWFKKEFE